jgi:PhnB protein
MSTENLTPWAILDGVPAFLDWLRDVFDAEETFRMPGPDGVRIVHAEARIGGSPLMMFDSAPDWPATPAFLRVYVPDADAAVARAVARGARVVTEPTTLWFGDRIARLADPWDNLWWVHTRVAAPSPERLAAGPTPEEAAAAEHVASSLEVEMRRRT